MMPSELTDSQRHAISEAIFTGQKITAIKLYREATRCGLAESKTFIDQLEDALKKNQPDGFRSLPNSGCGSSAALFFAGVLVLLGLIQGCF